MVDLSLRGLAVWDLTHRDNSHVNGSRRAWIIGLVGINSAGVLPAIYFTSGRNERPAPTV
ncbi:MAG: hypothetical protein WA880_06680 [Ornithinimicrobium sp.]